LGGSDGGLLPAVETRFKALVLVSPGFYLQERIARSGSSQLRSACEGSCVDAQWPFRFHLAAQHLSRAHVPRARNTHRAEAPRGLRYGTRHTPNWDDKGIAQLARQISGNREIGQRVVGCGDAAGGGRGKFCDALEWLVASSGRTSAS
jgi:hypothetical protein